MYDPRTEHRLSQYVSLWTSDRHRYVLVEVVAPPSENIPPIPFDCRTGGYVVIDDDDDVVRAVVEQMIKAGVPVVSDPPEPCEG